MDFVEKYVNSFTNCGFEQTYEESLKSCEDLKNSSDKAREEGVKHDVKLVLQVFNLCKEGKTIVKSPYKSALVQKSVTESLLKTK